MITNKEEYDRAYNRLQDLSNSEDLSRDDYREIEELEERIQKYDQVLKAERYLDAKLLTHKKVTMDTSQVTRVEIIGVNGTRQFMHWGNNCNVDLELQEENTTLKIFIRSK